MMCCMQFLTACWPTDCRCRGHNRGRFADGRLQQREANSGHSESTFTCLMVVRLGSKTEHSCNLHTLKTKWCSHFLPMCKDGVYTCVLMALGLVSKTEHSCSIWALAFSFSAKRMHIVL